MTINRGMDEEYMVHTYIHTMECYSSIKKNKNNASCSNMDGPRDCHTEESKSDRGKYHVLSHMRNLKKKGTNEFIYKIKTEL